MCLRRERKARVPQTIYGGGGGDILMLWWDYCPWNEKAQMKTKNARMETINQILNVFFDKLNFQTFKNNKKCFYLPSQF